MINNIKKCKDVKVLFERIENDNSHLIAKILWEPNEEVEDAKVYVELSDRDDSEKELIKLNGSNIWCANYTINNCTPEIINLDKKLAIKLVQYKVKPHIINS